jgi:ribosome-binding factor A
VSRPRRRAPSSPQRYQRTARLGELLREVIGDELERIGDERLELVAVTSIDVDQELNRAIVFYDAFRGEAADVEVLEAFGEHRIRLQGAIGKQIRARKTPILEFRPDEVLRSAERIERILRENPLPERPPDPAEAGETASDDDAVTESDDDVVDLGAAPGERAGD